MLNKENVKKKISVKKKRRAVFAVIGVLSLTAVGMVSAAVVKALGLNVHSDGVNGVATDDTVQYTLRAEQVQYCLDEEQYHIDFEELKKDIEETIDNTKSITGGEWSVYISIPSTGDTMSINSRKMQAASVIKLFIVAAVYDDYDNLQKDYEGVDIEALIESTITISDNYDADMLVTMLGRGDNEVGKKAVNDFCKKIGIKNTTMERMMQDDNVYYDNYTTVEDTAKLLELMLDGQLKHSKKMLGYLKQQTRRSKIPAGIPLEVTVANKTGELDDVQNDVAIVFAKRPYIICVMSDGISGYQEPIDGVVEISNETYNYIVSKM